MNVSMKIIHIPGKVNVMADLLSRWQSTPNTSKILTQLNFLNGNPSQIIKSGVVL